MIVALRKKDETVRRAQNQQTGFQTGGAESRINMKRVTGLAENRGVSICAATVQKDPVRELMRARRIFGSKARYALSRQQSDSSPSCPYRELVVRKILGKETRSESSGKRKVRKPKKDAARAGAIDAVRIAPIMSESEARPVADRPSVHPPFSICKLHRCAQHYSRSVLAYLIDRFFEKICVESRVIICNQYDIIRLRSQGLEPREPAPNPPGPPQLTISAANFLPEGILLDKVACAVRGSVIHKNKYKVGVALQFQALAETLRLLLRLCEAVTTKTVGRILFNRPCLKLFREWRCARLKCRS